MEKDWYEERVEPKKLKKRKLEEVAEGVGGISKLKFEVEISRKDLKELRRYLENSDVDTSDMDEEDLIRELFFQNQTYSSKELDLRDEVVIRRLSR